MDFLHRAVVLALLLFMNYYGCSSSSHYCCINLKCVLYQTMVHIILHGTIDIFTPEWKGNCLLGICQCKYKFDSSPGAFRMSRLQWWLVSILCLHNIIINLLIHDIFSLLPWPAQSEGTILFTTGKGRWGKPYQFVISCYLLYPYMFLEHLNYGSGTCFIPTYLHSVNWLYIWH